MKKLFTLLFIIAIISIPVLAIVSGQPLDQAIGDVKDELKEDFEQRQLLLERLVESYELEHDEMLYVAKKCNDLSVALYLQKNNFSFDLSYVLRDIYNEYNAFAKQRAPYDKIVKELDFEIQQYSRLVESFRRLPPELDSLDIPDSLSYKNASLDILTQQLGTTFHDEVLRLALSDSLGFAPFVLSKKGQADRDSCIYYASKLLKMYADCRNTIVGDSIRYEEAHARLLESYDYAYDYNKLFQHEVFVDGQVPYPTILSNFGYYWKLADADGKAQYNFKSFRGANLHINHISSKDENTLLLYFVWNMLFFLIVSCLIAYLLIWLSCKYVKPLGKKFVRERRPYIAIIIGAIFYLLVNVRSEKDVYLQLALQMFTTFYWLLIIILLALLVRMRPGRIKYGFRLYLPTMFMTLMVISCRVSFMPDMMLNFFLPPLLMVIFIWQLISCLRNGKKVARKDRVYCWTSLGVIGAATGLAFYGYIFFALIVLVWWYFQLAVIHSISALWYIADKYEGIRMGKKNWFYHLVRIVILPNLALFAIPLCINHALSYLEFHTLFHQIYYSDFLQFTNDEGITLFSISFRLLLLLIGLFFVFRYINQVLQNTWQRGRYELYKRRNHNHVSYKDINLPLGKGVISLIVWFCYIVMALEMLSIPLGSLGLIAAGFSVGIGIALKDVLVNFIYGISLWTGRLRIGDWIECDGIQGIVTEINYQNTLVKTEDGTTVSFLNSTLFAKSFSKLAKSNT